jgi:hypothetical protein
VNVEELNVLEDKLGAMSMARTYAVSMEGCWTRRTLCIDSKIAQELWLLHKNDQNFPQEALNKIEDFVTMYPTIQADPATHAALVNEVKMECLLATEMSPYLEVRANTESEDDPTMPCLTVRALIIGTVFAAAGSFIDNLFAFRQPPVYVGTSVGQLLACE